MAGNTNADLIATDRAALAELSRKLANVKRIMDSNPARRAKGEEAARSAMEACEKLRRLCSNIYESVEYHELLPEFSRVMDEARELIS